MKQLGYMDFNKYKEIPALSKSDLVWLADSPLHFKMREGLFEQTDEMLLGTLLHTALLEPKKLKGSYITEPNEIEFFNTKTKKIELQEVNRRSDYCRKALEEWQNAQPEGTLIVKPDMVDRLTDILTVCADVERDDARQLQSMLSYPGEVEVAASGCIEGVEFKGRADKIINHPQYGRTVFELKSTADSSAPGFSRQVYNMHYDIGISVYLKLFECDTYIFGCVETAKKSIHPVSLFRASESMKDRAHKKTKGLIELLKKCQDEDRWPAYTRDTEELYLPAWVAALDNEKIEENFT